MRRNILNGLSLLSLMLGTATAAIWVRSGTCGDSYQRTTSPYEPLQHLFGYSSYDGRLFLYFNSFYKPNLLHWKSANGQADQTELAEDWGTVIHSETINAHDNWSIWESSNRFGRFGRLGFYGSWSHESDRTSRDVCIPYCFLCLATAAMPMLWGRRRWLRVKINRRRSRGQCVACGYDLRETKEICPECGKSSTSSEDEARETKFRRPILLTMFIIIAMSSGVGIFWHLDSRQRPELQAELTADQIANALKPGMDPFTASDILNEPHFNAQYDFPLTSSGSNDLKCVPLPDAATLICEYPSGWPRTLISRTLLRFDDLKPSVPDDLFPAVRLIHLTSSAVGERFDPASLIRAVNALHSSGKTNALRALRMYVKLVRQDWDRSWRYNLDDRRAFLVARVLFERTENDQDLADVNETYAYPEAGPHRKDWPLFPLCVENDIPFCMVEGYLRPPDPHSIDAFLDRCEMIGAIRKAPLNPTATPSQAVEVLSSSDRWSRRFADRKSSEKQLGLLRVQGMRASAPLLTILRYEDWSYLAVVSKEVGDRIYGHFLNDERLRKMRWDSRDQRFAIRDQ